MADVRRRDDLPQPTRSDVDERSTVSERKSGIVIDLERLEARTKDLFLHRFVDRVKEQRGEDGRFLLLRAGDELAINAAADGSSEYLRLVEVKTGGRTQAPAPLPRR